MVNETRRTRLAFVERVENGSAATAIPLKNPKYRLMKNQYALNDFLLRQRRSISMSVKSVEIHRGINGLVVPSVMRWSKYSKAE
jgi:hypothetical protein